MTDILPVEIAYLKLAARRMFNFQKEAAERNEPYHDMYPGTPLASGAIAKMRYAIVPGGHEARLEIWNTQLPDSVLEKIAAQVLDGPATRYTDGVEPGHHIFRRNVV